MWAHAEVIVMRAQDHVGVGERRIRAAQQSRDVAHRLVPSSIAVLKIPIVADRLQTRAAELRGDDIRRRGPGLAKAYRGPRAGPKRETKDSRAANSAEMRFTTACCSGVSVPAAMRAPRMRDDCGALLSRNVTEPRPKERLSGGLLVVVVLFQPCHLNRFELGFVGFHRDRRRNPPAP